MKSSGPSVSVVLIAGSQRRRAEISLRSVLQQDEIESAEVLLFDLGYQDHPPLNGSDHPSVRIMDFRQGLNYGELRAEGARRAGAPIVAYIEEHCFAMHGWLKAIKTGFEGAWAGIGGEIHTANPGIGISDAVAMMNYTTWRPPTQAGESTLIAGHNAVYKRDVLLQYGELLGPLLLCEANLQWKLVEDGFKLFVDPRVRFMHTNEDSISAIGQGYLLWNKMFGHYRPLFSQWSPAKKAVRFLSLPLVPFIRTLKMGRYTFRERPQDISLYFHMLHALFISQAYSAIGMGIGMTFGMGDAADAFTKHELDLERKLPEPISWLEEAIAIPDQQEPGP